MLQLWRSGESLCRPIWQCKRAVLSRADTHQGFDLQPHLNSFARSISQQPLGFALYQPQPWAVATSCFQNAVRQAELHGGRARFGWMFHHRLVADILGPGYLIAVHHAVWHAPDGRLVDVTPFHDDPKHRPISPGGDVLFLVDTKAQPIVVGSLVGPRPSRFQPLATDERLTAHVRRLQEIEEDACRRLYGGLATT